MKSGRAFEAIALAIGAESASPLNLAKTPPAFTKGVRRPGARKTSISSQLHACGPASDVALCASVCQTRRGGRLRFEERQQRRVHPIRLDSAHAVRAALEDLELGALDQLRRL